MEGLARALATAAPVDVYAGDACLMQSLETLALLGQAARFVAGSEQIEDYQGLPYATWLPLLPDPPPSARCVDSDLACRAAAALPALQAAAVDGAEAERHVTLSVVDTARLRPVLEESWPAWGHALAVAATDEFARLSLDVKLNDRFTAPPVFIGGGRDLGAILTALDGWADATPEYRSAAAALRQSLAEAMLDAVAAERYGAGATGVAFFLPSTRAEYVTREAALAETGAPDLRTLYPGP